MAAEATSAPSAAATGHRPLPEPARFSPMNSNAKQAPAIRPAPTPAAGRARAVAADAGTPAPPAWTVPPSAVPPSAVPPSVVPAPTVPTPGTPAGAGLIAAVPPALAETPTIAGRARMIPVSARPDGRSPRSRPASTEKPAAPTALSGPATLNAACRKPRYSANAPPTPPRPAAAPQASAVAVGG